MSISQCAKWATRTLLTIFSVVLNNKYHHTHAPMSLIKRVVLLCSVLLISGTAAPCASLSLSSASATPGSSVALNLSFVPSGTTVAAAQWTVNYSSTDIIAIAATAGPALTAAQ